MVEISKRLYTEEKPGDLEDTAVESSQNVMQWRHRGKQHQRAVGQGQGD